MVLLSARDRFDNYLFFLLVLGILSWAAQPYNVYFMCFILLQYEKVLKFISAAKSEGATILCGGSRPEVKPVHIFVTIR